MEILKINEDIETIVRGLEIGFLVEKSSREGFLNVRTSKEFQNLKLDAFDINFLFSQLEEQNIKIMY